MLTVKTGDLSQLPVPRPPPAQDEPITPVAWTRVKPGKLIFFRMTRGAHNFYSVSSLKRHKEWVSFIFSHAYMASEIIVIVIYNFFMLNSENHFCTDLIKWRSVTFFKNYIYYFPFLLPIYIIYLKSGLWTFSYKSCTIGFEIIRRFGKSKITAPSMYFIVARAVIAWCEVYCFLSLTYPSSKSTGEQNDK